MRFASQRNALSRAWLTVAPSVSNNTVLLNDECRLLARWYLGHSVVENADSIPCPLCSDYVDVFGDHLVSCRGNGITERHNAFRDSFYDVCLRANISVRKEQCSTQNNRDADVLLVG